MLISRSWSSSDLDECWISDHISAVQLSVYLLSDVSHVENAETK